MNIQQPPWQQQWRRKRYYSIGTMRACTWWGVIEIIDHENNRQANVANDDGMIFACETEDEGTISGGPCGRLPYVRFSETVYSKRQRKHGNVRYIVAIGNAELSTPISVAILGRKRYATPYTALVEHDLVAYYNTLTGDTLSRDDLQQGGDEYDSDSFSSTHTFSPSIIVDGDKQY